MTLDEDPNVITNLEEGKAMEEAEKVRSLRNITSMADLPETLPAEKEGSQRNLEEKPKKTSNLKINVNQMNIGMAISASALKVGKALLNAAFFYGQELEDEDNPKANLKVKQEIDYHKDELLVEGNYFIMKKIKKKNHLQSYIYYDFF